MESGVDFERRIAEIYQRCRTAEQIRFEFDRLQRVLEEEIAVGQREAREKLLDNFDQEVVEKVLRTAIQRVLSVNPLDFDACLEFAATGGYALRAYDRWQRLVERDGVRRNRPWPCPIRTVAECNSAIRQIENLRYELAQSSSTSGRLKGSGWKGLRILQSIRGPVAR